MMQFRCLHSQFRNFVSCRGLFWAESQADRVFSRLLFPQLYKRLFSC